MKRLICTVIALLMISSAAHAEKAMGFLDDIYMIVPEAKGDALVRFEGGEKPLLSERARSICDMVMYSGDMYYLRDNGRHWELVCRDTTGSVRIMHAFEIGQEVGGLSAWGDNMFVMINGQLHMIYPSQGLCLKLAGAKMSEYVIYDDHAYYVSAETKDYAMDYSTGTAQRAAGCIYKVNLSTGDTSAVTEEGAYDISIMNGKLYFHSLSYPYPAANGDYSRLCGKICSYDTASGIFANEWPDYDWGYVLTDEGLFVRDAGGIYLAGEKIAEIDETDDMCLINSQLAAFDPVNIAIEKIR